MHWCQHDLTCGAESSTVHRMQIFFTKTAESATATGSHWKPNGSQWQVLNAQGYNIINKQYYIIIIL